MTFRSFEEISKRLEFDFECTISPANLRSLVDDYQFDGEVEYPCQVQKEGGRCNEMHKRGWLGCRKDDGREALIGRNCGQTKFNFSHVFRTERTRLNEKRGLQTAVERVQKHLDNLTCANDLDQLRERLKAVSSSVADLKGDIPVAIVRELDTRARDNKPAVSVSFRVAYDEDEKGKIIYRWDDPEVIRSIAGLSIWNPEPMRAIFGTLHAIRDVLRVVKADPLIGRRTLKKWADTLDELPRCVAPIAGFEARWAEFSAPENLQALCLLVRNENEGVEMARVILTRAEKREVSGNAARRFYDELRKSVSALRGNRQFKI